MTNGRVRLGRAGKTNPTGNGTINALQHLYNDHDARELAEDARMKALIEKMRHFEGTEFDADNARGGEEDGVQSREE